MKKTKLSHKVSKKALKKGTKLAKRNSLRKAIKKTPKKVKKAVSKTRRTWLGRKIVRLAKKLTQISVTRTIPPEAMYSDDNEYRGKVLSFEKREAALKRIQFWRKYARAI